MDEKAREFLDKTKGEKLISLGLIKETVREYGPFSVKYSKYDKETKSYYRERPIPIDVTYEEFEKICKYAEMKTPKEQKEETENKERHPILNGAEKTLGVFNSISLAFGVLIAIVCVIIGIVADFEYSALFFVYGIILIIPFILSWAVIKVFLNISNNLHHINSKLK